MHCFKCATPLPDGSRFCLSCGADVSGDPAVRTSASLTREEVNELLVNLRAEAGAEFQVHRELGRGGMAAVFLATETALNRKVAIKVLPPELTYGKGLVDRFIREAQTAAALDHPHIIPIYRVSSSGKLFWYAMKFVDGIDLSDRLKERGPLPGEEVVAILQSVAAALDYAHARQVVHRDVKPANVMLAEGDWVYVTDFGIAKALGGSSLTSSGAAIGTPFYMSPEQCLGGTIGPQADQYALAVMTYEMLSGHLPFGGESAVEILTKHCTADAPPLDMLMPSLPHAVTAVVQRAMAKQAEDRFLSTVAFVRALRDAVDGRSVSGPTPARAPRPRKPLSHRPPSSGSHGRRWRIGLGLTVIAAGGGWLGYPHLAPALGLPALPAALTDDPGIELVDSTMAQTGHLYFATRPQDAAIVVGDKQVVGDSVTLPLGSAAIKVSAPGYRDTSFSLELSRPGQVRDIPVRLHLVPLPAPLAPPEPMTGMISIDTRPPSLITIDGIPVSTTPLREHLLKIGVHHLHFHAEGFQDRDTTISVIAGSHKLPGLRLTPDSIP